MKCNRRLICTISIVYAIANVNYTFIKDAAVMAIDSRRNQSANRCVPDWSDRTEYEELEYVINTLIVARG